AQLFDLRAVTESVEHDIAALRGKSARDAEPDAAGGPGDNDGFALQHRGFVFESGIDFSVADGLARIFHQDAELWRRTGRDRLGSTGAANRSFYWQDGHARYGRPEPARIRGTPNPLEPNLIERPWIGGADTPASKRGVAWCNIRARLPLDQHRATGNTETWAGVLVPPRRRVRKNNPSASISGRPARCENHDKGGEYQCRCA